MLCGGFLTLCVVGEVLRCACMLERVGGGKFVPRAPGHDPPMASGVSLV